MSAIIHVAILTVSDTASQDASADKSGPTIAELLSEAGQFTVSQTRIVPDDAETIKKIVESWSEQPEIDLILTTGGTGFGTRDTTPEAIGSLIERHASGLVHLLIAQSIKYTPLAALSRPVAGTYKDTLIITLPGSVKAVKENMGTLLTEGVLVHAIELIKGGSGKAVHALLAKQDDTKADLASSNPEPALPRHTHHAHSHHRHNRKAQERGFNIFSHDPSSAVSERHRISPYPMVSMEDALEMVILNITPLEEVVHKVDASLRGHVLSEDIYAPQDVPSTNTTDVDGYALRSTDKPGIYPVLTSQTHSFRQPLPEGMVYRINTGGPLPVGADAVIMVEDTVVHSVFESDDEEDREEGDIEGEKGEEKEIQTLVQVEAGENVRKPGSDVVKGDLVIPKHEVITNAGGEIGTIAFVGKQEVKVIRKPVVAILSTGNEITDLHSKSHGSQDEWGGIWDTNRPSLQSALEGMGYTVFDLGVVQDTLQAHEDVLKKGLEEADILLTTGGTSMGPSDLLKPVIERQLEGTIHFGRVSIKPGKPVAFATIPSQKTGKDIPLFALPGNPASALVTFQVFVVPALRILAGWPRDQCQLPRVTVQVQEDMRLDSRTMLHRVVIKAEKTGLKAYSTGGQRSSRVASLNGANGFVILPQLKEGGEQVLRAKEMADAIIISELQMA